MIAGIVLSVLATAQAQVSTPLGGPINSNTFNGEATFYGSTVRPYRPTYLSSSVTFSTTTQLDGYADFAPAFGLVEGACGYGNHIANSATFPNGAAFAFRQAGAEATTGLTSFACGTCWKICYGTATCVGAMVTDVCPECSRWNNHIDMNMAAFQTLLPGKDIKAIGHVPITLQQQHCAATGPLQFAIHEMSAFFIKVHVQNAAGIGLVRLISVECPTVTSGPTLKLLENTWGAVFESKNVGGPPAWAPGTTCRLIATSFTGDTVASSYVDLSAFFGIHKSPYKLIAGLGNFPMGGETSARGNSTDAAITVAGRKLLQATLDLSSGTVQVDSPVKGGAAAGMPLDTVPEMPRRFGGDAVAQQ